MNTAKLFDINLYSALRYAAISLDDENLRSSAPYEKTTTIEDVVSAEKGLDDFCDKYFGKDIDMYNKVQEYAAEMAVAYERRGREEGIKMGMGLMLNALPYMPNVRAASPKTE